ncbi:MAG: glycosyltransferase family 4 protein [Anaerolineales bacterium]|nr:glycosyltransferase family 4 protein [Anaerolineales bacterium]
MRILLVTLHYYPEPNTKPHDLAMELTRRGHDVTVVTGFPHYPGEHLYGGYRMRLRQWETIDGIRVLRVPLLINRSKSSIRRIIYYLSFTFSSTVMATFLVRKPDVIWTYGLGLPGLFLSKLKRTPYVHEVQDLWPEWGRTAGIGMRDWLFNILAWQERQIRNSAKAVSTISEGFKRALIENGTPEEKITIIPNWANENNFYPADANLELGKREGLHDRFNVMYIGNVGVAQALGVVLDAATQMNDLPDVQFVIIGDGIEYEQLVQQARQASLDNVLFLGSRPQNQAAAYSAFADVLLMHLKANPEYAITIPSKTYAYLATGRPILAAMCGDAADLIQKHNAGLVVPPENPRALADAVRQLYKMSVQERNKMGLSGREAFLNSFTRQIIVDRYEQLFEHVSTPTLTISG